MSYYEISEENWQRIAHLLPGKESDCGQTASDNRTFINAVLWIARTGAPWRALPAHFGKWNSVFQRFNRWSKKGVWQRVFESVQDPDFDWMMLDSTSIRAHQHAAGQKKQCRN